MTEQEQWLASFASALERGDADATASHFVETSYWRDLVSFTWNIVTLEGREAIAATLEARLPDVRPSTFRMERDDGWFTFETSVGRGQGHMRLKDGKATTLFTALMELKGFEEKAGPTREAGTEHGAFRNRVTWTDRRQADAEEFGITRQPFVLVVGGGQGGIGLGARLKRIGVPALIVDAHERPGDAWRKRYKSLCLHDPVWYDHLPYLPFPDHWPIYTPKDKMGDWLESYVKIMELDYWSSSPCRSASFDDRTGEWTVVVERSGRPVTIHPKHLVLATGMSGFPEIPRFPGADKFKGLQHHSSRHAGGEGWAGKHSSWWDRTTPRTTSPPTCGSTVPTSPCCSARRRLSCDRTPWRATGRSIRRKRSPRASRPRRPTSSRPPCPMRCSLRRRSR